MKDRIKKFYHDHEHDIHVAGVTAVLTAIVVSKHSANAEAKGHEIVGATSMIVDDRERLVLRKKNGQITDRFTRPIKED